MYVCRLEIIFKTAVVEYKEKKKAKEKLTVSKYIIIINLKKICFIFYFILIT